jgi:hypothetical protein
MDTKLQKSTDFHLQTDGQMEVADSSSQSRYGPFKILENIGDNAFWLELPPYMQMYSMVNVEKLKLYEPPMIMDQGENVQVLLLMIFLLNILMSCRKMLFLTEG